MFSGRRTGLAITRSMLALVAVIVTSGSALADDRETVQVFYEYLSNPGSESHAEAFAAATADHWESVGDYSGENKNKEMFRAQLGGFAKLIPDLNWSVEEVLQAGNRFIVRSSATGTPNGPLFGVDGMGKSFEILTIDIHTIENEKITRTYHVEDWAGALGQLRAQ